MRPHLSAFFFPLGQPSIQDENIVNAIQLKNKSGPRLPAQEWLPVFLSRFVADHSVFFSNPQLLHLFDELRERGEGEFVFL